MSDAFYLLGSGAKATVYLGLNKTTGAFVAVKELFMPTDNAEEAHAILNEVQRLRSLSHPNVVTCYGAKGHNDKVHIILEYCAGGSVARTLRHFGKLSESICRRYMKGVVSGLHYLHKKGICHRDVKPENLLLTVDGVCKLGDLGSSKALPTHGGGLATCVGTPQYMAPEVIGGVDSEGERSEEEDNNNSKSQKQQKANEPSGYGTQADIWSLGCCLYEMLVGTPYISGNNPIAIMYAITSKRKDTNTSIQLTIPSDASLTPDAISFLQRCLVHNPNSRATADELMDHPWLSQSDCSNADFDVADVVAFTTHSQTTMNSEGDDGVRAAFDTTSTTCDIVAGSLQQDNALEVRRPVFSSFPHGDLIRPPASAASYSLTDFEPISDCAKTAGAMPSSAMSSVKESHRRVEREDFVDASDAEEVTLRRTHNATLITTSAAPYNFEIHHQRARPSSAASVVAPAITQLPAAEASSPTDPFPVSGQCQYCRECAALFECDECRRVFGNMYKLCPVCWPKAHSRLAASSAPRHMKRPLLTSAPYSASTTPRPLAAFPIANTPHDGSSVDLRRLRGGMNSDGGGVLLSNGAFVELSSYEEAGWTCGACETFNKGGVDACRACGRLN